MNPAVFGHHGALIRDGAAPPAAPTPAPAPSPVPPTVPPAFAVARVTPIDVTIGELISPAKTLATIVTTEANVAVVVTGSVPGCTVALTGSPVSAATLNGTPTTAGSYALTLLYLRDDGTSTVLGSSIHTINVIDPSILFLAGTCASYSGRAGVPVDQLLCSPSIALDMGVTAHPNATIPGCTLDFVWTRGGTSSGTLHLRGTPTTEGTTALTVTYRSGARILGTSAHTIMVAAAYDPPPPAPAPAPAPTPPTPAPAPSPAPAPVPGPIPGADPKIASVLGLWRFNALDATTENQEHQGEGPVTVDGSVLTIARDTTASRPENGLNIVSVRVAYVLPFEGENVRIPEQFDRSANVLTMTLGNAFDPSATRGYVRYTVREAVALAGAEIGPDLTGQASLQAGAAAEALGLFGGPGVQAAVPAAWDLSAGECVAECMVRIDEATGLWTATSGTLLTPVMTLLTPDRGAVVWTLALASLAVNATPSPPRRAVFPVFIQTTRAAAGNDPLIAFGPEINAAPAQFKHLAGQWLRTGTQVKQACWFDGAGATFAASDLPRAGLPLPAGGRLQFGGSIPIPEYSAALGLRFTRVVPLHGAIDEARITSDDRYTLGATAGNTIAPASRVIPWPNY